MKRVLLHRLWERFHENHVSVLVLRDFENLPAETCSDLDIAVRGPACRDTASRAIRQFANDENLAMVQLLRRAYVWEHKLYGKDGRELVVDLHFEGEGWRGPLYLTNDELFAGSRDRGLWREPALHHQVMMAAFQHLLWGGFYKSNYHSLVPKWLAQCEPEFAECVARAFGADITPRLIGLLMQADAPALATLVPELRQRLWQCRGLHDLTGSLRRLVRFFVAELVITFSRHGRWIVFIGPDGVGKTTVAGMIAPGVKAFFRSVLYHHWIPGWKTALAGQVPPGGSKPTLRPVVHGPMASLLSALRLARNLLRSHMGYWLRVWPALLRQRLVIGDRYLFNYHLDPASVRYYGPSWLVRFALLLAPQPDLVMLLSGDPDMIHQRKAELSPEEIARIISRARNLPSFGIPIVELPAHDPPGAVAQSAAAHIIRNLGSFGSGNR